MNSCQPKREGGEHNIFTTNDNTLELLTLLLLSITWMLFKIFSWFAMLGLG